MVQKGVDASLDVKRFVICRLTRTAGSTRLLIPDNQPFSQWDGIFTDSMMTVAAIDRLVHHGVIIEVQVESYRKQVAAQRSAKTSAK